MSEGSLGAPVRNPVDWQNPAFLDAAQIDAETRRVFDICLGCRRCFNLCDSFPRLFDLVDALPSGDLNEVPSEKFKAVVDACTLCDLCFMTKCPYVPPHEFNLDFPHLMLRHRAAAAAKGGVSFTDRELTKTDRNGHLARYVAPLANWATATSNKLTRGVLEKVAQVHHEAELPRYSGPTFLERAEAKPPLLNNAAPAFGKRKAVLYATCTMNFNTPEIGMLARAVMAKNGVETRVAYSGCCGMPQLEQGDLPNVVERAAAIATSLQASIDEGFDIIALVPSCALMFKFEWPLLVPKDHPGRQAVERLAAATFDLSEFMVDVAKKQGLAEGMSPLPGPVALHLACHARAQNMGAKAAEMLRLLPQKESLTVIERCSGHGGSWGVKKDNFPVALKVGKPVAKQAAAVLEKADAAHKPGFVASECPLAAVHIMQGIHKIDAKQTAQRSFHPIELFALAYGITDDK